MVLKELAERLNGLSVNGFLYSIRMMLILMPNSVSLIKETNAGILINLSVHLLA